MADQYSVPDGMVAVPGGYQYREKVDPVDLQRDDIVRGLCLEAQQLNERLKDFKRRCHKAIGEHLVDANDGKISEEQVAGKMPPLTSLDGSQAIEIEHAPVFRVTEKVTQLKVLIKAALDEMGESQKEVVSEIVKKVLRIENGRTLNVKVANQLKGVKSINTPSWNEAMALLPECTRQEGLHTRFRFYQYDEEGNKTPMLQNFSRIPVGVPDEARDH